MYVLVDVPAPVAAALRHVAKNRGSSVAVLAGLVLEKWLTGELRRVNPVGLSASCRIAEHELMGQPKPYRLACELSTVDGALLSGARGQALPAQSASPMRHDRRWITRTLLLGLGWPAWFKRGLPVICE